MSAEGPLRYTPRVTDWIFVAWRNLDHTSLLSSLVLAVFPLAIVMVLTGTYPTMAKVEEDWAESALLLAIVLAQLVFYPLARELFKRLTHPVRESLVGLTFFGYFVLIYYAVRFVIYYVIWVVGIPLGIVAYLYLTFNGIWRLRQAN